MTRYYLGISSDTTIELLPDEGLSIAKRMVINQERSASGYMYEHKKCHYDSISVPVVYMPTSMAYAINSWWQTQAPLQFLIVGEESAGDGYLTYHQPGYYAFGYYAGRYWPQWTAYAEVFSCMIAGDTAPLRSTSLPYDNRFKGTILLEGY